MKSETITELTITSPSFEHNEFIPVKHTCDDQDISPAIRIGGTPSETQSLALIIDDPDAPNKTWVHWVMWNIPPTEEIKENSIPGVEGINDFQRLHYGGPCPPPGTHRYFHKIYALDCMLDLAQGASKEDLLRAMDDHVIGKGELIGLYKRI